MRLPAIAFAVLGLGAAAVWSAETPAELRDLGIAQLENERPAEAAATFTRLAELTPKDPLPWANLALANLRQQRPQEARQAIERAVRLAPQRADVLAIAALITEWEGDAEGAVAAAARAAAAAPQDVRLQYQVFRIAQSAAGEPAETARRQALRRLVELRPENLAVLLQQAQGARERGDRPALTSVLLRVRELLWQAPEAAAPVLAKALEAVELDDLDAVRVPLAQLENLVRTTPMYREGVRELDIGILGEPVLRFAREPEPAAFGPGIAIELRVDRLADTAVAAGGLAVGDFDGDGQEDLAWAGAGGALSVRWGRAGEDESYRHAPLAAAGTRLLAFDLDDDGRSDLLQYGGDRPRLLLGAADRTFEDASGRLGAASRWTAAAATDYDIEGDLDLVVAGPDGLELLRNALDGPLVPVGRHALPQRAWPEIHQLLATDLDRDGDPDLVVVTADGLVRLDNLRQGTFAERPLGGGTERRPQARAAVSADLDNDGWPDLVLAGRGVTLLHNRRGELAEWKLPRPLRTSARFDAVAALDADNDGRLDLALAGPGGVVLLLQRDDMRFDFVTAESTAGSHALAAIDIDGDGDLDIAAGAEEGVLRLTNEGGDRNHWVAVRLRGLTDGSSKNNAQGLGSVLEVRNGPAYQFREVTSPITHFGLGRAPAAQVLRVLWTNGVPQNRLDLEADQLVVEEQVLKGSCPFLYTWDGERFTFVTDLLWNTMLGMPFGAGEWAPPVPTDEIVRVDGAVPRDGAWELRVTGELWEVFYFDSIRLWVVDHPEDVEVASNLRVLAPGTQIPPRVLATRNLRPLAGASTGTGRDLTALLAERDERYAHAFEPSRYQGIAREPWSLVLDLGEAPAQPIRLVLEGWLYPPDASLNVATSQRQDLAGLLPRLEVETAAGWQPLMPDMGLPAGKIKPTVVDTPPLPAGARRLRIVSTWWLAFDRIRWSTTPADAEPVVRARLDPHIADFRYRGFSTLVHPSPWGSHQFDYARISTESPWLPLPGSYTRYGDVRPLLTASDSRTVIVGPGDELALTFDAQGLPAPPTGWRRTVFLQSDGWGKDADRNTLLGHRVEPLPFRGMHAYPYEPEQSYPPALEAYRGEWLTRIVSDHPDGPM